MRLPQAAATRARMSLSVGQSACVAGVQLERPDDDFPANAVVSTRKSVEEATVFVGFDD